MEDRDIGGLKNHYDKLREEEKILRLKAFYSILQGKPASSNSLSLETGILEEDVKRYIQGLKKAGVLVLDKSDSIIGSHGLSLVPTNHSLYINNRSLYTWCAADAIGIPAALEMDADILSSCAYCKETVKIHMVKGKIQYSTPKDLCLYVVEADLGKPIVDCT